ncbi:unnamed protein product [Brassicogethes aeneus]|uniref:Osiris 9 n=1 Tax=Brassicogethes aeneus TaxID=1431903 RepID=A0A9P0B5Q5_BRAAE|nr:unnamed protein product [Brassicogethes aeneus]
MRLFVPFVFVIVLCFARAEDEDQVYEDSVYSDAINFVNECGDKELSLCFKERALKYLESLPNNVDLGSGIKIKENFEGANRASRQYQPADLPEEPRARENELDNIIIEKLADYFTSHTFEFKMPTDTAKDLKRSMEEGRKKKNNNNKGGGMMNMMMLIQLKAAILGAIFLKVVALVAFKALLVAKVALTIASVIALKKIVEQKHHSATYEVVSHPHAYEDHGHYDRSFSQDLAYNAHKGARHN